MSTTPLEKVLSRLRGVRRVREGEYKALCPAHDDHNPSLHVKEKEPGGRVTLTCYARCEFKDILNALGLEAKDLYPERKRSGKRGEIVAVYDYVDSSGKLRYQVVRRKNPKSFRQRRPDGKGGFIWDLDGEDPILYRLPEVEAAKANGGTILVVEGEKDVDNLRALGFTATCNPMGAGKWRDQYSEVLRGANVVIIADKDEPGRRHAEAVAKSLHGKASGVRVMELPDRGGIKVKDASDWIAAGGTKEELIALAKETLDWEPQEPSSLASGNDPAPIAVQINLTDLGNARRLVQAHGKDLRFCHPWGKWLVWDGRRWEVDSTAEVNRRAKDVVRLMYAEAAEAQDVDWRKALVDWARRSESQSRIEAMIHLAKSEPGVPVRPEELDRDPWLFNCLSGTIDLRTAVLRPHRREDLITKLAPVEYDPDAECPAWLDFMNLIFGGDQALISFFQRWFGYTLTGNTDERALGILFGDGRNGKTTTQEHAAAIMGDYALQTPADTLLATKRNNSIPNDIARLKGVRFVRCSELEEGARLAEAKIKALVGGDTISARFLHAEWFEFVPEFKLWISTNHRPVIRGTDSAIWDRIRLIPFTRRIESPKPRREVDAMFRAEYPGILAWAVKGCLEWQRNGLGVAEAVARATDDYRASMDVVGRFVRECCHVRENLSVPCGELYEAYVAWAEANGEPVWSQKTFGDRLNKSGYVSRRGSGGVWRRWGLTLIDASREEPEPFPALLVAGGNGNGKDPF